MSSEKDVKVTVEACGEVRAFECRCTVLSTGITDLDARREILDMAAKLGVDADF